VTIFLWPESIRPSNAVATSTWYCSRHGMSVPHCFRSPSGRSPCMYVVSGWIVQNPGTVSCRSSSNRSRGPSFIAPNRMLESKQFKTDNCQPNRSMDEFKTDQIRFLREQDGPPERELKNELANLFVSNSNVLRAYLVCVAYKGKPGLSVALCLVKAEFRSEPRPATRSGTTNI